jgi:hypothetical protein
LSVPSIRCAGAAGAGAGAGADVQAPTSSSETNSAERNLMNPASVKTAEVYLLQQACRKVKVDRIGRPRA